MKKTIRSNPTTKTALFAGALALMALTTRSHAQSADALIDKLVDKGVLTVKEAQDLREDADKNFTTAFQAKTGMPDWIAGYKFSGDFRGRVDEQWGDNQAFVNRMQLRYRLRVGVTVSMLDNIEAGFRLGTGNSAGNPLSNNTTFSGNAAKKPIWVDTAYGKWTVINSGAWMLSGTFGKMDNPFRFTPMVFDPDYTPEGGVVQGLYRLNDRHTLSVAGGGFVLNEITASSLDPYFIGAQVMLDSVWSPHLESSIGGGVLSIDNTAMLTTAAVGDNNSGNTRTGGALNTFFNPLIADASITYKLDSFPFYTGMFPIKIAGEYMNNPATSRRNKGYWVGATLGKSGTRHTWDLSYRYEYLEANAWYEEVVDDDMGALYSNGLATPAFRGGTNVKGHMVKLNYSVTDALTFTVGCYVSELIDKTINSAGAIAAVNPGSSATHLMVDLSWKF